jgi:hypothetical protein
MTQYLIQAFAEKHELLDITAAAQGDACWARTALEAVRFFFQQDTGLVIGPRLAPFAEDDE